MATPAPNIAFVASASVHPTRVGASRPPCPIVALSENQDAFGAAESWPRVYTCRAGGEMLS